MTRPLTLIVLMAAALLVQGPPDAAAAITGPPTLTSPDDGAVLTNFAPVLTWANPGGTTQYHIQVVPFAGDGPGIDLHVGRTGNSLPVPPPPRWYGLLPDMTYTWRVRTSDSSTFASLADGSWGPWAERRFRTPGVSSGAVTLLTPADGDVVTTATPTLHWLSSRDDVFYYELELSRDDTFTMDPAMARAPVYSLLVHGGVTEPGNSYTVPGEFRLDDRATYYWRVRPRVQGDGVPVEWPVARRFLVDSAARATLAAGRIQFGRGRPDPRTCTVPGAAATFAASPALTGLHYAYTYSGSGAVSEAWYRDGRPFAADVLVHEATSTCAGANPPLGDPGEAMSVPIPPGAYRLDLLHAGQRIGTATVTVTPAAGLILGPVLAGVAVDAQAPGHCRVTGVAAQFPSGTPALFFRFNTVGTGAVEVRLWRGFTPIGGAFIRVTQPAGCRGIRSAPPGGWTRGDYRLALSVNGDIEQELRFRVN